MPTFINFSAAREWEFVPLPIRRVYWTIREWTTAASGRLLASLADGGPPFPVHVVDEEGYTPLWLNLRHRGPLPREVPDGGVFVIEEV